jgi:hypothetical protein
MASNSCPSYAASSPPGSAPLVDQVRRALTAHYEFYEQHALLVLLANRSDIALDPVVRQPITDDLNTMRHRPLSCRTGGRALPRHSGVRGLVTGFAFGADLERVEEVAIELVEPDRHDEIGALRDGQRPQRVVPFGSDERVVVYCSALGPAQLPRVCSSSSVHRHRRGSSAVRSTRSGTESNSARLVLWRPSHRRGTNK